MPASTNPKRANGADQPRGCYVYGVVPADTEVDADASGVGDPPGRIALVRSGDIAALVTDVALDRPLGTPADLTAHQQLLDAAATEVPVLPFRFGAVLTDRDAVVDELLEAHHDDFAAALRELEGRAEYIVKARYAEDVMLAEMLSENPDALQLREKIRNLPPEAARNDSIALGEMINQGITAKREADTRTVVDILSPLSVAISVREPTHELDAAYVAVFVEASRRKDVEQAVAELTRDWQARADVRLLGPLAAYDFVTTPSAAGA